ncbi:MAG: carbohydrate binding family 9 domain-containing protein [candidate division WOR-3 bacterium]|nr:MAG: carbohydrate binding family 9 domain-containing protein [candidate division WOR-3 bacterium]
MMSALLITFMLIGQSEKTVSVNYTSTAPRIDGVIEDIWQQADSAYDFVQYEPYETEPPNEKTAVYVLQDDENLYVAFRCYAEKNPPFACYTKDEDYVRVSFDPFGSNTTGYYFLVFASQLAWDGWVLDDGRVWDDSWEGIWYRAAKLFDDRWEVEIKIPFKSIRYKKGLNEWGIQFLRYTCANRETDFWTSITHSQGEHVSEWGTLTNIDPRATGYYFELYPEAYVRIDRNWYDTEPERSDTIETKPSLSLNAKWDITPQTTFNATVYPDFAQIESDPFTLNLGRYPTYLSERRPFFIEGRDIFRMSSFGDMGFFQPLELFYSRRIGKSLNGDAIPIITGMKLTHNSETWNIGALGAYTDDGQYYNYAVGDTVLEPNRGFGIFRIKNRIMETSEIGLLFSGTRVNADTFNYAVGVDAVYRNGVHQFIAQGARSDKDNKQGWAFTSGYYGMLGNIRTMLSAAVFEDSFDVSDVGFVPWAGLKRLRAIAGPYLTFPKGFLQDITITPGLALNEEPGTDDWSTAGFIEIIPHFRNRMGSYISATYGKAHETSWDGEPIEYTARSFNINIWGPLFSQHVELGCWYGYEYNYARDFAAYRGGNWCSFNYSIIPPLSVGFNANLWPEWDTTNTLIQMTSLFRPNITIRFNAYMTFRMTTEFVMLTPGSEFDETDLYTIRTGALFSWNFKPKSWLYIAINDYHARGEDNTLEPQYTIAAVKAKYLLYF